MELEDMFKKFLENMDSGIEIKKIDMEELNGILEKKLGEKGKIAKAVHDQLSDPIRDAVFEFHMNDSRKSSVREDYTMIMAILCGLLADGKIMLKRDTKQ